MTCMYKHYEIKTKMIGQGGDKNLLGGGRVSFSSGGGGGGGGDFFQVERDEQIFGWWGDFPHPTPSRKTLVSAATNFHIFQTLIISRLLSTNFQTKQSFYLSTSFLKYPCHY